MKTNKLYSSKEDFEKSHKYVIVLFNVIEGETIATIEKYFCTKKQAEQYFEANLYGSKNHEIMTTNKYYKEALMCM